jgi:flagellar hook-associated protein 3 FlgL
MRVSTALLFRSGTQGIQNLQSELFKTQNQMSTGRRILTPQDDPIGASEVLKYSQSKGVNQQFLDNQSVATTKLSLLDTTLSSVGSEVAAILERAEQAGNPSFDAANRGLIATELKARFNNLMSLANTQDGTGLYVFSGFQSTTKPFEINMASTSPFSLSGTYVSYHGDGGNETLQVTGSQTIETGTNGLDVFMQVNDNQGNPTGRSMFDTLKNLIDMLDPASGVPFSNGAHTQAVSDLRSTVNHIATARASVGARLNALESMTSTGEDTALQYDLHLSKLQDLDYAEAISRLSSTQLQLEAAQLSFKEISRLSLFSIL